MTRWLETDSLSNQNIASGLAIGAYTADADRLILCQFFADQVTGNGDYDFWLTHQIAGSGSSYRYVPKTTATVASGVTAIAGQSIMVAVRSGDVLTAYLDGLAGDTTTPDTTVRWFEMAALRPDVADRQVTVAATGEASANVTYWAGVAAGAAPATVADLPAAAPSAATVADAVWDEVISGHLTSGTTGARLNTAASASGSGATAYSITVEDESNDPIDGVEVWITTDAAGLNVIAGTLTTDAMGLAIFMLDAGDYYVWRQRSGYNFTNPVAITVS